MKKHFLIIGTLTAFLFSEELIAQVSIGKDNVTNSSVLFEFGTEAKGIILPAVDTAPGAVDGTFILDNTVKAVRVRENGSWKDLSTIGSAGTNPYTNTGPDSILGINGVVIGADTSAKPGVLVLESTTRAFILPNVSNPDTTILSPVAGTMVYETTSSDLAVYDGAVWNYWR